ncbi:hypothetical protein ACFQJ7_16580 [Halovenus rubra]|uniref:Uncharacterized protein n=2 Tax=Halovenus rubra TaxID=869890 RepID=A0ABD5XDA4_9EURY|nr:hypothetical protein [Halovenus rubra]
MSAPKGSRRTVLAGLATAALGGFAGCSSVPGFGNEEDITPRRWLYDPTKYTDKGFAGSVHFESPTELIELGDHLSPEVLANRGPPLYEPALERDSVEWAMMYSDTMLRAPFLRVYAGSFDAGTAKAAAAKSFDATGDGTELDGAGSFDLVQYGDDQYGLSRDGEMACVRMAASEESVRSVVDERSSSSPGIMAVSDELMDLVKKVGFDTSMSVSFNLTEDGTLERAAGYGYTADGATTTVRVVMLYADLSSSELEEVGEGVDALTDVTVGEDGKMNWLEATVETNQITFNKSPLGMT